MMTIDEKNILTEQIKMLRFKRKKTQEACAKALDISIPTYKNIENNPNKLTLDQLINLSDFLNYNFLQFFLNYILQNAISTTDADE